MVTWMGPLATINREPGQTWKGAATAVALCAGVWLVQVATLILVNLSLILSNNIPILSFLFSLIYLLLLLF